MPPKRKGRPKSSSSDAFSPEEKKSKEANRSTSTSEGEDEVLTALSMAESGHDIKQIAKARQH